MCWIYYRNLDIQGWIPKVIEADFVEEESEYSASVVLLKVLSVKRLSVTSRGDRKSVV